MHLSDEQIQRLMHGELDPTTRDVVPRHVLECAECAQTIAIAKREEAEIFDLLHHVDHEMPVVDAARITSEPVRGRSGAWGRRAAGVVIVAALAGAAYAIPGSPLPNLLKKVAAIVTGESANHPAPADESTRARVTSGISVPAGEDFVIQFAGTQDAGAVTISAGSDSIVTVRVLGGTAAFTTDAGRLDIDNRGSGADYEIELPGSLSRIEIRIASFVRFSREGDVIRIHAGQRLPDGRIRISLAPDHTTTPGQ